MKSVSVPAAALPALVLPERPAPGDSPAPPRPEPPRASRWVGRGLWAIVDQGTFSASNLLLSIVLARWMPSREYGVFAVAYSVFLLVAGVHSTLLVEPMLVFGPGRFADAFRAYLRGVIRAHWALTAALAVGTLSGAVVLRFLGDPLLASAFAALSATIPTVLLAWLVRRASYVVDAAGRAAMASVVYAAALLGGLAALRAAGQLTVPAVFLVLAAAGLVGAAASHALLATRLGAARAEGAGAFGVARVAREHLPYSRWALASSIIAWVPTNAFVLVGSLLVGLEAAAALRAMLNVVAPAYTVWTAIGLALLPSLVRASPAEARRLTRRVLLLPLAAGVPFWLVVGALRRPVIDLLYHGRYGDSAALLIVLGAYPLVVGAQVVLEMYQRSREQPRRVFVAWLIASLAVLPATAVAARAVGITAAAVGVVGSYAVCAALLARALRAPAADAAARGSA